MNKRIPIFVAGLGRCGSTLTMQMLWSAGVKCAGSPPAWECGEVDHCAITEVFLACHAGHAIKLLDPHQCTIPKSMRGIVVWLHRNPCEQAKSYAKFMAFTLGQTIDRAARRLLATHIERDEQICMAILRNVGPIRIYDFEDIILHPDRTCARIASYLGDYGFAVDANKMAGCVLPRSADCASDLSIELRKLEAAERS
jgi:hypothetical protein